MYEVISIDEAMMTQFVKIKGDNGIVLEVFDYSDFKNSNFQIEVGKEYEMKLMLFGDLINKDEYKTRELYGEKIVFNIIGSETIGLWEFYRVSTKIGNLYIYKSDLTNMIEQGINIGVYNYTRIDLVQVNNQIHPDLLK